MSLRHRLLVHFIVFGTRIQTRVGSACLVVERVLHPHLMVVGLQVVSSLAPLALIGPPRALFNHGIYSHRHAYRCEGHEQAHLDSREQPLEISPTPSTPLAGPSALVFVVPLVVPAAAVARPVPVQVEVTDAKRLICVVFSPSRASARAGDIIFLRCCNRLVPTQSQQRLLV